ncbi:MAG: tetratricopeptide repeat protein [Rikenellaceae bacterium]
MKRNKLKQILLAFTLCITLSVTSVYAQAQQSYLFLRGVELTLMGKGNVGETLFQDVLKINPTHAPSLWYLGEIYTKRENLSEALKHSKKAYDIDTTNALYTEQYARLLIGSGELEKSLPLFLDLISKEPHKPDNYIIAATIYSQLGNMTEAVALGNRYEELFGLDDSIVETIYNGYLYSKEYFFAMTYMERVSSALPDEIAYALTLADIKAALNYINQAEALYKEVLEKNPQSLQAQLALANFYKLTNNTTDYIKALKAPFENLEMNKEAKISIFTEHFFTPELYRRNYLSIQALAYSLILTYPSDLDIVLLYGRYLTYMGETDSALAQYELIQEKGKENAELLERLIDFYLYTQNYDKALTTAKRGQEVYGGYPFLNGEIVAYWQMKEYNTATKLIDKAVKSVKVDSLKSQLYGLQGDIFHEMGQDSKSYKAYKKGLKYNPDNALILNNYGYFMGEKGKSLKSALQMTTRANELSPDNPTYLDSQAWVLYMMGEYVEAQLLMVRVMELDANPSGEVLMHYGDILYALGDDYLARHHWKRALEAGADADEIEKRVLQEKAVRATSDE